MNKCVYKVSSDSASVSKVGYAVTKIIAKKRKSYSYVEFVEECLESVMEKYV